MYNNRFINHRNTSSLFGGNDNMMYEHIVAKLRDTYKEKDASFTGRHFAIQFNIWGEGHGALYMEIKDGGQICIEPYEYFDRDTLISTDADTLLGIAAGKIDPASYGDLYVEGDFYALDILKELSYAPDKEENKEEDKKKKPDAKKKTSRSRKAKSKTKAGDAVELVKEKAGEAAGAVKEKAGEAAGAVKEKAGEAAGAVKEKAGEAAGAVKEKAEEAAEAAENVKEKAGDAVELVKEKAEDAAETVKEKAGSTRKATRKKRK